MLLFRQKQFFTLKLFKINIWPFDGTFHNLKTACIHGNSKRFYVNITCTTTVRNRYVISKNTNEYIMADKNNKLLSTPETSRCINRGRSGGPSSNNLPGIVKGKNSGKGRRKESIQTNSMTNVTVPKEGSVTRNSFNIPPVASIRRDKAINVQNNTRYDYNNYVGQCNPNVASAVSAYNHLFMPINHIPMQLPQAATYHSFSSTVSQQQSFNNLYLYHNPSTRGFYKNDLVCRSNSSDSRNRKRNAVERDRRVAKSLRTWELTKYGQKLQKNQETSGLLFTVMSFNVLAQDLLNEHVYLYKDHDSEALSWENRFLNLMTEIKQQAAEILCLQEVQQSHLGEYITALRRLGYDLIYKKRTSERTDGCAIFYKVSVLHLVEYTTVEFNQPRVPVLDRENVAIIARFAPKDRPQTEFVIATTHLLYNPRREDVRLAQTQVLLAEIDRIAFHKPISGPRKYVPIILTGDFNSQPNSPLHQLITTEYLQYENLAKRSLFKTNSMYNATNMMGDLTGKFLLPPYMRITDNCQHADLVEKRVINNISRQEEMEIIQLHHTERKNRSKKNFTDNPKQFASGALSHNLALQSVFLHRLENDVEATTYQDKWITVDYIFYSGQREEQGVFLENKLKLVARYTIPTRQQLDQVRIPNFALGSDHLSLIAKFKLLYN